MTNKPRKKAVMTFLLRDTIKKSEVLVIRYKNGEDKDYYDIPGKEIIDPSITSLETSKWNFYEETGMFIENPIYKGNVIIEKPNEILDIDVYIATKYEEKPCEFEDRKAMWLSVEEAILSDKTYPSVEILNFLAKDQIKVIMELDENNNFIKIIEKWFTKIIFCFSI